MMIRSNRYTHHKASGIQESRFAVCRLREAGADDGEAAVHAERIGRERDVVVGVRPIVERAARPVMRRGRGPR